MGFFRRLFGGGGRAGDRYVTYYVRPKRCSEVLAVRVDRYNDLSLNDDGKTYFARKVARGERCPFPAELHIDFNANRVEVKVGVQDGELVDETAYQAFLAQRT